MLMGVHLRVLGALLLATVACPGLDLVLRPTATVAAAVIRLGDVADTAPELAAIPVQRSAEIGRWSVDARQILAADPRLRSAVVSGVCTVVRPGAEISAADLAAASLARIQADSAGDRVEATLIGLPSPGRVPLGASVALIAEALSPITSGRTPIRVRILADGRELDRRLLMVDVRRCRTVLVAARALRRDTLLAAGDLRSEAIAITLERADAISALELASGRMLLVDLADGSPVLNRQLRLAPAVRAGQAVTLLVRIGAAEAATAATALGDGAIGDRISVRRLADAKTVTATITGAATVQIDR